MSFITPFDTVITMRWHLTGAYDDSGIYKKGAQKSAQIRASVQRLSMAETQRLPEGMRNRTTYKLYTEVNIVEVVENTSMLDGAEFVIMGVPFAMLGWERWTLLMPHWKITVVEIPG